MNQFLGKKNKQIVSVAKLSAGMILLTASLSCAPASFKVAGKVDPNSVNTGILPKGSEDAEGSSGNPPSGSPAATIKVNGSDQDLTVVVGSEVTVDWASTGALDCVVAQDELGIGSGISGSTKVKVDSSATFSVICQTPSEPISSDVKVDVIGSQGATDDKPVQGSSSPNPATSPSGKLTATLKINQQEESVEIPYEGAAVVDWSSSGATACQVEPNNGQGLSGQMTLEKLRADLTVTLACQNSQEQLKITRMVKVTPPPPPMVDLKVNGNAGPLIAPSGTPLKVTWTTTYATQCVLESGGYPPLSALVPAGDADRTAADQLVVHTLKCEGPGGSATANVVVTPVVAPPTVVLTADGKGPLVEVLATAQVKLAWTSKNATKCFVTPGLYSGVVATQLVGPLSKRTDYTALCEGPFGLATASVVVLPKTADLDLALTINGSPTNVAVAQNSEVKVSWVSSNAVSCQVQPFGFSGLSGRDQISPKLVQNTKVVLTCRNAQNQSKSVSIDVTVIDPNKNPPKVDLKANGSDGPLYIDPSRPVQLVWTTQNVVGCQLDQSLAVAPNGSKDLTITSDVKVVLTCKNGDQNVSDEVAIKVRPHSKPACKVGINIKDGGKWSGNHSKPGFYGVAVCGISGSFNIYGQDIVSLKDQTVGFRISRFSQCEHSVSILTKGSTSFGAAYKSSHQGIIMVALKKDQLVEVTITNLKGCPDTYTRSSNEPTWSQITANQCLK